MENLDHRDQHPQSATVVRPIRFPMRPAACFFIPHTTTHQAASVDYNYYNVHDRKDRRQRLQNTHLTKMNSTSTLKLYAANTKGSADKLRNTREWEGGGGRGLHYGIF